VDRNSKTLLFFPPKQAANGSGGSLSVAPNLLNIENGVNIEFSSIQFRGSRGSSAGYKNNRQLLSSGVAVTGGANVSFVECDLLLHGSHALSVDGGTNHRLSHSTVAYTGGSAVLLHGGNRTDLTAAEHSVSDSVLHTFGLWQLTYNPAVYLTGVGCVVTHCDIYGTYHSAILFAGNDHRLEHNWIHDAVLETYDSGAIYAGRDWTWRGIVIRGNVFGPNIGRAGSQCSTPTATVRNQTQTSTSCVRSAIYLDDHLSGSTITGNVFLGAQTETPTGPDVDKGYGNNGIMVNGGRDHSITNNLFIRMGIPATVHGKAMWRGKCGSNSINTPGLRTGLFATLFAAPFRTPPWSVRYPQLAEILAREPCQPRGNLLGANIVVNSTGVSAWGKRHGWSNNGGEDGWASIGCGTGEAVGGRHIPCCEGKDEADCFRFGENLVSAHPGFAVSDPVESWDFSLSPASKAWAMGWKTLNASAIGPRGTRVRRNGRVAPDAMVASSKTDDPAGVRAIGGETGSSCTPAPGADPSCCNLTLAAEYGHGSLMGKLDYDLDSADLSMAQAAAISCCDSDGTPCAVCLPPGPTNVTVHGLNRLLGVLRRWRCFGGEVRGDGLSQTLDSEAEVLQAVARSGCACSGCPQPKCDISWWWRWTTVVYALLLLLVGCGFLVGAGCWWRRATQRRLTTSAPREENGGVHAGLVSHQSSV
jgi:hypothetical protein